MEQINDQIETMTLDRKYDIVPLVAKTKELFKQLTTSLKELDSKTDGSKYQTNMINGCKHNLSVVSKRNNELISMNRTKQRREYSIHGYNLKDEKIDEMIRNGEKPEMIVKHQILFGNETSSQIKNKTQETVDKYQDVLILEASVAELHQMFLDLAVLTQIQGEMLDNIELSVQQTNEWTGSGNEDLVKSIEYQKSIRGNNVVS